MTVTEKSEDGTSSNTAIVTVVTAPGASARRSIKNINIYNADSANASVSLKFVDTASANRSLMVTTLSPGDTLIYDNILILDNVNKSVTLSLAANVTTAQLMFVSNYIEMT